MKRKHYYFDEEQMLNIIIINNLVMIITNFIIGYKWIKKFNLINFNYFTSN